MFVTGEDSNIKGHSKRKVLNFAAHNTVVQGRNFNQCQSVGLVVSKNYTHLNKNEKFSQFGK